MILKINNKKNKLGQSMFEVVLALFIITMIIVAVVILSTNAISNSLFSRSKTQGSRYSQEAVEWIRAQRELNSSDFIALTNGTTYCLDSLPQLLSSAPNRSCSDSEKIAGTNLIREVNFTQSTLAGGEKIVNATVVTYWEDAKGYHETRSVTDFSDIREK